MKKKKKINPFVIILLVIAFLIGSLILVNKLTEKAQRENSTLFNPEIEIEVETVKNEGAGHSTEIDDSVYKSYPPTSGPHYPQTAKYGFYEDAIPVQILVHNLEHGDIVIYYQESISDEDKSSLEELTSITFEGSGVLANPNDRIDKPIVVTAWDKKMTLDSFDYEKVMQFIFDNIYKGPEKLPPQS